MAQSLNDPFDYHALLGTPSPELGAADADLHSAAGACSSLGGFNPLDDVALCGCWRGSAEGAGWRKLEGAGPPGALLRELAAQLLRPSAAPAPTTAPPCWLGAHCRAVDSQEVVAHLGPLPEAVYGGAEHAAEAVAEGISPDGLQGLDLHALASADLPEHAAGEPTPLQAAPAPAQQPSREASGSSSGEGTQELYATPREAFASPREPLPR